MIRDHQELFPAVTTAKCKCDRHKSGCGFLGDNILTNAIVDHFCCLQQCNKAEKYARRMRALGKYHCRDIHEWGDGETSGFHPNVVCSCGNCDEDNDLQCSGKPYKTKNALTCEYHQLAYQIECERRASDAANVIHSVWAGATQTFARPISLSCLTSALRTKVFGGKKNTVKYWL